MAFEIDHFPGRELKVNGKSFIYFGGTSYLGLQTDADFQKLFIANIKKYGTNYGASRKSNVRLQIFDETEAYLAKLVGSEACTTLSSGYLSGQLIAQHFNTAAYTSFYAPNTHSALFTDTQQCFNNYDDLNAAVRNSLQRNYGTTPVVFLDAIDFSAANYPSFKGIAALPLNQLMLVVDDSHGIGIVGPNGSGVYPLLKRLQPKELIISCSLGKAFGVQAGAIFGPKNRIAKLTDTEFFGGASPATPAALASLQQAATIYNSKRNNLQANIALFKSEVNTLSHFSWMENHPAFSFTNPQLTAFLKQKQIVLTSFNYPNEAASVSSRIIISAAHTEDDIRLLAAAINSFFDTSTK